jgi:hypothetical protein
MDDPRNIEELIMDNGLPQDKPVTLKDVEQINKDKHHKNMQNRIHRIDDSYQLSGEKPMSTADKPTSKFMDAMTQVLANEAEIMEKKKMTKGDIAALAGDPKNIDAEDFAALRAKKHLKKEEVVSEKTMAPASSADMTSNVTPKTTAKPDTKFITTKTPSGHAALKGKMKEEVESVDEVAKAYSLSGRPLSDKKAAIIQKSRMDRAVADEQRKNDAMKAKKEKVKKEFNGEVVKVDKTFGLNCDSSPSLMFS